MKRLLLVDDDASIRELLRLYLRKEGYDVICLENGEEALRVFSEKACDLLLLDLMLPGKSGFDVLRELRRFSAVPVIILTARGDVLDKVVGLELGADDYVEKPFDPKELIARINAVLRRVEGLITAHAPEQSKLELAEIITQANLIVDKNSYTAQIGGVEIEMPPKELELLFFLASHPNRVLTRDQLLDNVWGIEYAGESRTVDVHIKRVREKVEPYPHPDWQIKTVWSVGYKFELR